MTDFDDLALGYDIPARPGMAEADIQTPCLIVDMEAMERNMDRLAAFAAKAGVALRPHAKTHKSADVAKLQMAKGAAGICCQKVAEAEALARGGVTDILLSNEVRDPAKLARLARLPSLGAAIAVCVDDIAAVADLSAAAMNAGTTLGALVEIDCGQRRCGAAPGEAGRIARAIADAPGLRFEGVQAYHGGMQHTPSWAGRSADFDAACAMTRAAIASIEAEGLTCAKITGAGTGSYRLEAASGIYTELQAGSYVFMDADYGRVEGAETSRLDQEFENALFLLTSVMSKTRAGEAVVDAGLKSQSVDSGLPMVWGRDGLTYTACSDEHGQIADPSDELKIGDRVRLIPGHCDPTCNLHDWYVMIRGGVVETLWPVTARGKAY